MRRADRILVSGVRIGRLFLLFSLPLLLALRYRPALSEAESCTEKPNFPPQVIAAPFNCGHAPLCVQRGYGGRWLTPLRHYDSRPLRAANCAVSSKSGRLIRRWRRLSQFPPCFRWGVKGEGSLRQRFLPLALHGSAPLREQREYPPGFFARKPCIPRETQ